MDAVLFGAVLGGSVVYLLMIAIGDYQIYMQGYWYGRRVEREIHTKAENNLPYNAGESR